jgi:2'-5' RNA ligase
VKVGPFDVAFRNYGFFPGAKSPRVFWIGIEGGPQLAELARSIDLEMSTIGVPKEVHPYSPHLTLARSGSGSPRHDRSDAPNRRFQQLQEKLMQASDFGGMTAREFFLYQSQLSPKGSRYTKIAQLPLSNVVPK